MPHENEYFCLLLLLLLRFFFLLKSKTQNTQCMKQCIFVKKKETL